VEPASNLAGSKKTGNRSFAMIVNHDSSDGEMRYRGNSNLAVTKIESVPLQQT
jgi:hypothetical protein